MKRIIVALSLLCPPTALLAIPGYEPFADASASGGTTYPVGNKLGFDATLTGGQTNAQGFYWAEVNTGASGASVGISNANLSFSSVAAYSGAPNLPSSSGNAAFFANISSKSARLTIQAPATANITSGSIYGSMLIKLSATNGLTSGYICGFNNTPGTQASQPSVLGAKVAFTNTGTGYLIGTAKAGTSFKYDTTQKFQVGDTAFVVVKYTFGASTPSQIWVNPPTSSFGTYTEPAGSVSSSDTADISGSPSGIGTWVLLQNSTIHGAGYVDEVRFGRTWASVTGGSDIFTQPANKTVAATSNATFTVSAIGDGTLLYQWYKGTTALTDGGNISGSTTRSLTVSGALAADAGSYSVIVTNNIGSITSSVATLTVTDPAIVSQPVAQTLPPGATANFSVTAVGTPTLTYLWYKGVSPLSDGGNISGSTTATLSISGISGTDAASYTCAVTNGNGAGLVSSAAALSIVDPAITSQPANVTANFGSNATFNVSVAGSGPFTYQWYKGSTPLVDGGNISGSASASLTVSTVSYLDAGGYSVIVTNASSNTATSSVANLTVKDPVIYAQPTGKIVLAGDTATFTVNAGGTGLTYSWKKGSTVLTDNGRITGSTTASLSIGNVSSADNGSYTVVVTSTAGSNVTSSAATLSSVVPPLSRVLNVGAKVTFTVAASGTAPFNIQWTSNGVPIPGATFATLTKTGLQLADTGTYTAWVTNSAGVVGAAATLAVSNAIHLDSTNLVVLRQGDGSEAQANTGNSLYLDQYTTGGVYVSTLMLPNSGPTSLLQSGTASTEGWLTTSWDGRYLCIAGYNIPFGYTNVNLGSTPAADVPRGFGTINGLGYYNLPISSPATYSGLNPRSMVTDGTNNYWTAGSGGNLRYFVPSGTNVTVSGTANNRVVQIFNGDVVYSTAATPTYGIHKLAGLATVNGTDTNIITTGNSASFPADFAIDPTGTTIYITEDAGAGAGNTNFPGVQKWTYVPGSSNGVYNYTIPLGNNLGTRQLTADFSVSPPILYVVTCGSSNTTAGLNNSIVRVQDNGPSSTPLTIVAAAGANQGFRGIRFAPAAVDAPGFVTQPASRTNATGSTATFSPKVFGSDPKTFQWYAGTTPLSNGGNISGANTASLSIANVSAADQGNYSLRITNELGYAISSDASLTVLDAPGISSGPSSLTKNAGDTAQFTVTASGGGTLTYQWRKNGSNLTDAGNVSGSLTSALNLSNVGTTDAANYDVVVANEVGSITSVVATLTVTCPGISVSPATLPDTITNVPYSQTISASGGAGTYSFAVTTGTLPSGLTLTGAGSLSGAADTVGAYNFTVTATDGHGCTGTQAYTVNVTAAPANPAQLTATALPDSTVKVTVTGSPNANYGLQGSTNLTDWNSLITNSSPSGSFDYIDGTATNTQQRFFRALTNP